MSTRDIVLLLALIVPIFGQDPTDRSMDPVVLKGADIPELRGFLNYQIVGFQYVSGLWQQVPIQIDEMRLQQWSTVKQGDCWTLDRDCEGLVWADTETFTGQDDGLLDDDDELVFMARHLGEQFISGTDPPGVEPFPKVELEIVDPLKGGDTLGRLYLFICLDGSLTSDAGQKLVNYDFNLLNSKNGSNAYKDAYEMHCAPDKVLTNYECKDYLMNPEDSWFTSPYYERHFAENWFSDELRIKVGGATGEDFIDIQEFQFLLDGCVRCTASFMNGDTAFETNKDGAVRAIRAWVGANSGTVTTREHIMYEQRDDQITHLRVHTIPGSMDYMVYKAGVPLTYYNCHHPEGVSIDGKDDNLPFDRTACHWEYVTGATGTYIRTIELEHDLHNDSSADADDFFRAWYFDSDTPDGTTGSYLTPHYDVGSPAGFSLCSHRTTGQTEAWGTHGFKLELTQVGVGNTCPLRALDYNDITLSPDACFDGGIYNYMRTFIYKNRQYYLAPDLDPSYGEDYYNTGSTPLVRK